MTVVVVGIGADGWSGLTEGSRQELQRARVIHGAPRQLQYLPADLAADLRPWPSPMIPGLASVRPGEHVLASGDPMFYGIGATLTRHRPDLVLRVLPHLSSFALACARLGWPAQDVVVVSAVARDPAPLVQAVRAGRRVIALSESGATPDALADLLAEAALAADLTVLEQLGGERERVRPWHRGAGVDDLNVVAVEPRAGAVPFEFEHDGQITKSDIRAVTVAALRPSSGWVWDFGAGSGSVGISWALAAGGSVVAVERRADRADRVRRNAARAGVRNEVVVADSADLSTDLPRPDAIFIGGGLTETLAAACVGILPPGGRLVANTVTVEGQTRAALLCARFGGALRSYTVADQRPLGAGTAWEPRRPVVQWIYVKEEV
ncbi:Precorrin-6y C5,15-methyltransferase (Decarboxylating), CbiE subunit OS=Tsukamurella paurometabola(strain ATCC 8368 / DSM / CCUG 35730 / CIP 100753 / JCM 10117 / KCTC 9821 / NBRC 16120 / NCIMB 702349 / NCTC 13040)OX=521096 GN=Tpau_2178 PE=3 SV=1 [Tsukamurella paurometabola]|uniref:Precorrin-6y C5,15-methyltransferase (Decarboxylating), CbiE subunit n=1 Tax=Tsukamurella paurometabola (strain ATCC 8368 / DSM 20162 / CCUG 35730 / CIP 100753 / JCM 10117 / KCTC 9821 / NBRC 16120 / NCIMB 702349 / NCTC 13040) TaxID=521096 RepID=D5UPN2_TSUPD|nr:bifunctional cobalt-precorrin-7 (C(5))-methyltransferase/cobalt-precorrin-6B (C(15))-methyltransferase [Tsukamurella paurometabola]ADG78788.1 precorrin-6y C5,15-methyltransferase (decarboxylating), CbiE subunit [Tsukamurella paurometabola DSM 20162]SUP33153.1 Precorrin-6Y C(5,15)-methyltransferase [decarboxylating] [Tsukamurella paurometabola]